MIELNESDLEISTFRPSWAGGFSNATDVGVRIYHAPSGITTECETAKNQHRNKASAMNRLREEVAEWAASLVNDSKRVEVHPKPDAIDWLRQGNTCKLGDYMIRHSESDGILISDNVGEPFQSLPVDEYRSFVDKLITGAVTLIEKTWIPDGYYWTQLPNTEDPIILHWLDGKWYSVDGDCLSTQHQNIIEPVVNPDTGKAWIIKGPADA